MIDDLLTLPYLLQVNYYTLKISFSIQAAVQFTVEDARRAADELVIIIEVT